MRNISLLFLLLGTVLPSAAFSAPLVLQNSDSTLSLSIYNQNLTLVKDDRQTDLKAGVSEIVFDGVAKLIQAETALVYGQDIKVLEQNYSYNLMTNYNMMNRSVGEEVTTVRVNPEDGENIFEKARLIGIADGAPVLQFPYGIESEFSGRIIFPKIPDGLSNKPMLTTRIDNAQAGRKTLHLAYLTGGISWQTDYVANVTGKEKMNLTGWVTINNHSGIDYNKAKIQLISGDVNSASNGTVTVRAPRVMMMAKAYSAEADMAESVSITPESLSSFELYTLPNVTTIKDQQAKQIALLEKKDVVFKKIFALNSPLNIYVRNKFVPDGQTGEFEKAHPSVTYEITNDAASNLNISLPKGVVRFYENDKNGNLQFIGSDNIGNTPKGEKAKLNLGKAFNLTVKGKLTETEDTENSRKNTAKKNCYEVKKLRSFSAEVTFSNAEKDAQNILFTQNFPEDYKLLKESLKSSSENAFTRKWNVNIPAKSKTTLTFTVAVPYTRSLCQ